MNEDEVLAEFRASQALLEGHFLLSSGRHSAHYLQCARVLMNPERAEVLALEGLGWLAGQEDGIQRFLTQSGIDAATLRDEAGSTGMNVALLDFLLGHEDLLLPFCESLSIAPKDVHMARHVLGGEA